MWLFSQIPKANFSTVALLPCDYLLVNLLDIVTILPWSQGSHNIRLRLYPIQIPLCNSVDVHFQEKWAWLIYHPSIYDVIGSIHDDIPILHRCMHCRLFHLPRLFHCPLTYYSIKTLTQSAPQASSSTCLTWANNQSSIIDCSLVCLRVGV